jgi:hypothetical protein
VHQMVEHPGRLIPELPVAGNDTRQRRVAQLTRRLVIAHADHGDVVGHDGTGPAAGVQHPLSPGITASHDGCRLREPLDPLGQSVLVRLP